MKKILKAFSLLIATLAGIGVVFLLLFAIFFKINDPRDDISALVGYLTDRELEITGDFSIKMYPSLAVEAGRITLSNTGEYGTVMGNHRLKSLWRMKGENRWMNPQDERNSFIAETQVEIALNGATKNINGKPSDWSNHRFRMRQSGNQNYARDSWNWNSEHGQASYWIDGQMPNSTEYEKDPVRGLSQINYFLGVDYRNSVPVYNSGFGGVNESTTKNDTVKLVPGHPSNPAQEGSMLQAWNWVRTGMWNGHASCSETVSC